MAATIALACIVGACGASASPSVTAPATGIATLPTAPAAPSGAPSPAAPATSAASPAPPTASPKPTPSPKPTAPPSPEQSEAPWTSSGDLAWHRLATVSDSAITGVVGFAGGYVALDSSAGVVWHSPDGRAWKRVRLPLDPKLGASPDANDMLGRFITTNGREVLVVGGYSHEPCGLTDPGSTGGGPDCSISPIAWITGDGRTWRASDIGTDIGGQEIVAAWPVEDGWYAAVSSWFGEGLYGSTLARSADGLAWKPIRAAPPVKWEGYEDAVVAVTNGAGTYLLAASERGDDRTRLALATAGEAWQVLRAFPGPGAAVQAGVAPSGGGSRWVLGGESGISEDDWPRSDGPTIWSSPDGERWSTTLLPAGPGVPDPDPEAPPTRVTAVTSLVRSERGYVAVGAETSAEGARHETWVSDDGVTWVQLAGPDRPAFDYGPGLVAAGPAGVIGISPSETEDTWVVWQLR